MRRRLVAALAAASAVSALASCSVILGIDHPPLRSEVDAAAADVGTTTTTPLHCSLARLAQGSPCSTECRHAFCDDFEDGDRASLRGPRPAASPIP